jgi:hypothetical protein
MNRFILSIALVTILAACGSDAESREDLVSEAVGDTVLHTEASQPAPAQPPRTAPAESPRTVPAESPRTAPAEPVGTTPEQPVRAIEAGTLLTFEVRENVSTSSHDAGDSFSLVLVDAVAGPGQALLPAGSSARGLVTESHSSSGPDDQSLLALRVVSVEAGGSQKEVLGQTQSADIESSTRDSGTRTAATIATGAAAGAIIGQVLGRDTRSTVTGAAVGTAVGVGVALTTRGGHAQLPEGSRIVVRLSQDLIF